MPDKTLSEICDSTGVAENSFYQEHYRSHGIDVGDVRDCSLPDAPQVTWSSLQQASFEERTSTSLCTLVKIVRRNQAVALFARTRDDIKTEYYGVPTNRPLVAFDSLHEGLEKSIWVYEQNYLPLIAEEKPQMTVVVAARYGIDGIIGDTKSINELLPLLAESIDLSLIKAISVVDTTFNLERFSVYCPNARVSAVLALPEAGTIATACSEALKRTELIFHPVDTTLIEHGIEALITRLIRLPTPIVRYESGLTTQERNARCACENNRQSFVVKENRRAE